MDEKRNRPTPRGRGIVLGNDRDPRAKVKAYRRRAGGYDVYSEDGKSYYGAMPEGVLKELYGNPEG